MAVCRPEPVAIQEAVEFAQDICGGARHNGFMRRLSLLGLLAALSCQTVSVEDGDSMFRRGNYPQALAIYSELAVGSSDAELQQRVERTRYFMLEQGVRDLLHLDRPEDALEVLDYIDGMAPPDRLGVLADLRTRSERQVGRQHLADGFDLYESNDVAAAAHQYVACLVWDPDNEEAEESLQDCERWLSTRQRIGEDYYFRGMDFLRGHQDLRARTSFMHAANLLGEDSRARERLAHLTISLAEESRDKSKLYLEAGLIGQAWSAAQDALYLAPQDDGNLELAAEIRARLLGESYLLIADIARRGGKTADSEEYLQLARDLSVEEQQARIAKIAEMNQDRRNRDRYARARAYEMDSQMFHARMIYEEILSDEGGFGWLDIEQRVADIGERLAEADRQMAAALVAKGAGDTATYLARLQDVLRLSVDYPDAMAEYRALLAERE
jgi:tetratricopeptide (TPR) repeat protein